MIKCPKCDYRSCHPELLFRNKTHEGAKGAFFKMHATLTRGDPFEKRELLGCPQCSVFFMRIVI